MSTALVLAQEPIRRLRRSEYEKLAALGVFEDERVELLEGVITGMSPQGPEHQWSIVTANEYLVRLLAGRAQVRVQLPLGTAEDSEPEPDFAIVTPTVGISETPTAALLVIEVSDSTVRRDRDIKAALYARASVPEYWLIDVPRRVLEVRTRPAGGQYTHLDTYEREAKIHPVSFPDLAFDLAFFIPPPRSAS
jgi:Uma2 family endonuclease